LIAFDQHKLSIVAAVLPPVGDSAEVQRLETTEKAGVFKRQRRGPFHPAPTTVATCRSWSSADEYGRQLGLSTRRVRRTVQPCQPAADAAGRSRSDSLV
jgi:hypothetical protein